MMHGSMNIRFSSFLIPMRAFLVAGSCRQPQTYVKPDAAITVFELLMMSGVSLETC